MGLSVYRDIIYIVTTPFLVLYLVYRLRNIWDAKIGYCINALAIGYFLNTIPENDWIAYSFLAVYIITLIISIRIIDKARKKEKEMAQ